MRWPGKDTFHSLASGSLSSCARGVPYPDHEGGRSPSRSRCQS